MEIFQKVAQEIKARLDEGNYSFITLEYGELQSIFRKAAGNESIRLAKSAREGITEALSDVAVKVFPSLEEELADGVRFFRSGTLLWNIVTNLRYPNSTSDAELAKMLNQIKQDPTVVFSIKLSR
jgi:hypothetical protein